MGIVADSAPLATACLDCTKYASDDAVGSILAQACQAIYFTFCFLAAVAYTRRDLLDDALLYGAAANVLLGKVLKAAFRQARPAAMCQLLGVCDSHGMPSTHAQVAAYCLGAHAALTLLLPSGREPRTQRLLQLAEAIALLALLAVIGYARVYLGYHTPAQVAAGAAVGASFAALWTAASLAFLRRLGDRLLRLPGARQLGCQNLRCRGLPAASAGKTA